MTGKDRRGDKWTEQNRKKEGIHKMNKIDSYYWTTATAKAVFSLMSDRVTINDSQTCTMAVLRAAGPFGMRGKWRFCWDHFLVFGWCVFPVFCLLVGCQYQCKWLTRTTAVHPEMVCPWERWTALHTHTPSKPLSGKTYTINKNRHWHNSSANLRTHSSKHWTMKVMSSIISFRRICRTLMIWDQDATKDN